MRMRSLLLLTGVVLLHASSASALPINYFSKEIAADVSAEARDGLVPPLIAAKLVDPAEEVGTVIAIGIAISQIVDPLNSRSASVDSKSKGTQRLGSQKIGVDFDLVASGTVEGGLEGVTSGMGRGRVKFSFGPSLQAGPGATLGISLTNALTGFSNLPTGVTASAVVTLENVTTGMTIFDSGVSGFSVGGIMLTGVSIDDMLVLEYSLKLDAIFQAPIDINPTFALELTAIPLATPEPQVALLVLLGLGGLAARAHRNARART